jgi:hypothetical protein
MSASASPHPGRLRIRSGGQSGVDRAALDFAVARGIAYGGWCPAGGLAEDLPTAPGLLERYPGLTPTPSADARQRTAWNVRDADATVVVTPNASAEGPPGTELTLLCARLLFPRPLHVVDLSASDAEAALAAWLEGALQDAGERGVDVNVAGPRESELPGAYRRTLRLLDRAWSRRYARRPAPPSAPPGG